MPFYNTIELQNSDLDRARRKASSQQERILAFFMSNPGRLITPDEVWTHVFPVRDFGDDSRNTPITSIRRAMTNLTKDGLLVKTCHMRAGYYGDPVHCWQLAAPRHGHVQKSLFGGAT